MHCCRRLGWLLLALIWCSSQEQHVGITILGWGSMHLAPCCKRQLRINSTVWAPCCDGTRMAFNA